MAGRKPKPTALKKLEGNPGKRKLNTKEPMPGKGMRIGETTGETVRGRGSRNPYSPGSYRTAGGSRVQNREMEDGGMALIH